jgi:hypothetical protein
VASWVARLRDLSRDNPRGFALRVVAAVAGLGLTVFGWQAVTAVLALNDAKAAALKLTNAIAAGDAPRAETELKTFDDATTRAHHRTDGPLWWAGSRVPILGRNIDAVSTIAAQSDAIADDAMPGIVAVADRVQADTFRPRNGRVDLEAVEDLLPVLATTDRVMARADKEIGRIQTDRLMGVLQVPVAEFAEQTKGAATAAAAAHDAGRLLPTMLAGTGPTRHYLLMILNNAEVRSIGGMPGSFAVLEARRGKVEMREQSSNAGLERDLRLSIKPELRAGFSRNAGYDLRDTAIIPDFPRVAELSARLAESYWDTEFDGVAAVDPVALGYVLSAVGALDIGDGITINQANAAQTLLNGIYLKYPILETQGKFQDAAFEQAARLIFDSLTAGRGNSVQALRSLVRGVQEDRILLWSAHESEQKRIQATGISGSLTDRSQPQRPQVGLFLNDMSQAKLDYYLHSETRLEATKCYDGDVQDLVMTTTLTSNVPQGSPLPTSIVGYGKRIPIGIAGLSVRVFAPPGGEIRSIKVDGKPAAIGRVTYMGRQLARLTHQLQPGANVVIVTEFRSGRDMPGDPMLKATPSVYTDDRNIVGRSACY